MRSAAKRFDGLPQADWARSGSRGGVPALEPGSGGVPGVGGVPGGVGSGSEPVR